MKLKKLLKKSTDNTLAQWEERFKKEIEFEKRETSLF